MGGGLEELITHMIFNWTRVPRLIYTDKQYLVQLKCHWKTGCLFQTLKCPLLPYFCIPLKLFYSKYINKKTKIL